MEDSLVLDHFEVTSHKGKYQVLFVEKPWLQLSKEGLEKSHIIIDRNVFSLYQKYLQPILKNSQSVLCVDATEDNKSLERLPGFVKFLTEKKIRRNHQIVAIGGGIIQDITCFLAATLLRGIDWIYYPTTLLAQADSCIGSKSSINCRGIKNILGTFTPANKIVIASCFLSTLDKRDLCSGVGEMLKVHALESLQSFDEIALSYNKLFEDFCFMQKFISRSLKIKKYYIEKDEFDQNIRNVMNYGHSFGHAIESASDYLIPHGVAVSMGIDIANYVSASLNVADMKIYQHMHDVLYENFKEFLKTEIIIDSFFDALTKDKKNVGVDSLTLILVNKQGEINKHIVPFDAKLKTACSGYLLELFKNAK